MSGPACEALARGTLDAVLMALPWDCGTVETMALFDDPFYLVFHPDDMMDPPPSVAPDSIDDTHLLLLEDGHCLKDQALAACGRPELRADPGARGTSLLTLVQMVAGRLGQTLVPKLALDAGLIDCAAVGWGTNGCAGVAGGVTEGGGIPAAGGGAAALSSSRGTRIELRSSSVNAAL